MKSSLYHNSKILPIRIKQSRVLRGYTLEDVASKLNVSKQMISRYELGTSKIDINNLVILSKIVDLPIGFFYKPIEVSNSAQSPIFFRTTNIPKRTQEAMEQKIELLHEITTYLERYVNLPEYTNELEVPNILYLDDYSEYIEKIATAVREDWGLGDKPVYSLTKTMLKRGFIVSQAFNNNIKIDGYSKFIGKRAYSILGLEKDNCVRSRFSLAHELGHSILHYDHIDETEKKKNHKLIEEQAHRFASAFLLPATSFSKDVTSITLESFIGLKSKWRVSISAMVRRCYDLDIIGKEQYTNLNKSISYRGWKKTEPLDDQMELEKANIFKEAFDLLFKNNIISPEEAIENLTMHKEEIEKLCFLPDNYFNNFLKKPQLGNDRIYAL